MNCPVLVEAEQQAGCTLWLQQLAAVKLPAAGSSAAVAAAAAAQEAERTAPAVGF